MVLAKFSLIVNGHLRTVETPPDVPLLYVLRNELSLNGPKFGCGMSQCGACSVIVNHEAVRSCVFTIREAQNKSVTTLEGLGTSENPSPLQRAFLEEQAAQCGYCINGMIMAAHVLLEKNAHPNEDEIKEALNDALCRCGSHLRIVRAIQRAARAKL